MHIVDKTFCSIPTNDANCCYLDFLNFEASAAQSKPEKKKKGSDDGVSAASQMIKSAIWRGRRRLRQLELRTFPSGRGEFLFYTRIFLGFWKDRDFSAKISLSLSKTNPP